ncbi:MAG: hypothetical protein Q4A27_02595 [bacterium]|nr:hypothetical protein [bacterium]
MENFKINNYESSRDNFEEFETLSLEHLNDQQFSREKRAEIESAREKNQAENLETILDIYEKAENSNRENASFFDGRQREVQQDAIYFEDYAANFAQFEGREGFIALNENRNRTQESLAQEITQIKQEERKEEPSKKLSKISKALGMTFGFRKSA